MTQSSVNVRDPSRKSATAAINGASERRSASAPSPKSRARRPWKRRLQRARRLAETALAQLRSTDSYLNAEVAFLRALGTKERDPALRCADSLAEHFLTPKYRVALGADRAARLLIDVLMPGAYGYVQARTKYIDQALLEAAHAGITQLVVLGAGNDSRAYRLRSELATVRTYEVDLPEAQKHKLRILSGLYGGLPDHVRYVPLNFERGQLDRALLQAGFDVSQRSLFIWEGVSMFLTAQAADGVIRALARLAAPGSSLVFDYCLRSFTQGRHDGFGGFRLATLLARQGMRYRCGFDPDEAARFLAERGFVVSSDVGPEELERRYLTNSAGRVRSRVFRNFRLLSARATSQGVRHAQ